ncbi:MAG: hypothetical protein IT243_05975 [Bacteroidia bacterium]|nr:hypothetical protein [Bacteroidia bacterium]
MQYKTGDILVVPTKPIGIFEHYGIVYYVGEIGYVAHNSFTSGKVISTPLNEFLSGRKLLRVIPSKSFVSDAMIYDKVKLLNGNNVKYNFFGFNCEEFVKDVCLCDIGTIDQRREFAILAVIILSIVLVLLILK